MTSYWNLTEVEAAARVAEAAVAARATRVAAKAASEDLPLWTRRSSARSPARVARP